MGHEYGECRMTEKSNESNRGLQDPARAKLVKPDWVNNTPEAKTAYALVMENRESCDFDQRVMLDRGEYDELKRHLAEARGLIAPTALDDPESETALPK